MHRKLLADQTGYGMLIARSTHNHLKKQQLSTISCKQAESGDFLKPITCARRPAPLPFTRRYSMPRFDTSQRTPAPLMLMLGDSLVAGYNWQVRIPQFTIRNCGVPGATTTELLSSMPRLSSYYSSARLAMVMIGTNDLVLEQYGFIEDLKKIVLSLTQIFPGCELLINSLLPIRLRHLGNDTIPRLNSLIEAICRKTGSCYVDVHARFVQTGGLLFQADGIHLTEEGYELWARTLLEHIAFLLEND
jgi:lysophospholipase L1-like esterase